MTDHNLFNAARTSSKPITLPARVWLAGAIAAFAPAFYALVAFDIFDTFRSFKISPWPVVLCFLAIAVAAIVAGTPALRRPGRIKEKAAAVTSAILFLAAATALVDTRYPAKYVHLPEYLILGWALARLLSPGMTRAGLSISVLTLVALAALLDESIQGYMASRSFGLQDIAVDLTAGLAGILIAIIGVNPGEAPPTVARRAFWTAVATAIAAVAFTAFALSRFAALHIAPDLWVHGPILVSAFAGFSCAFVIASETRPCAPSAALCCLLGLIAALSVTVHGVRGFVPLVFH